VSLEASRRSTSPAASSAGDRWLGNAVTRTLSRSQNDWGLLKLKPIDEDAPTAVTVAEKLL
jgi:hypothetical protein